MSCQFSLHNVTAVRVARRENNGTQWLDITLESEDGGNNSILLFYHGPALEITGDVAIREEAF